MNTEDHVDRFVHQANVGVGNLLGRALISLPEEEADEKLQAMEDGRGRFFWEPGNFIVVEIEDERFLECHLYEALAASLWPVEQDHDLQPA